MNGGATCTCACHDTPVAATPGSDAPLMSIAKMRLAAIWRLSCEIDRLHAEVDRLKREARRTDRQVGVS
jgi:hypothetical protein